MSDYFSHEPLASMSLFFGLVLIFIGIIFKFKAPKTINSLYGYRSRRSMKDQAHWDFAHQYSAKESVYLGLACMAAAPIGWMIELSELTEAFIGLGLLIIICFSLFYSTEKAIKKKFDE